ncbi:MAG: hypothetical protein U0821_22375 [Chloroflexota bacterium]
MQGILLRKDVTQTAARPNATGVLISPETAGARLSMQSGNVIGETGVSARNVIR